MENIGSGELQSVIIKSALINEAVGANGLDVTELVTEVEVYTSLMVPFKTGKMLITDGRNALDSLRIVGGEIVEVTIKTANQFGEMVEVTSSFVIDGVSNYQRIANNSIYKLSLSSVYMHRNMHTRVSEHFSGKTSEAIRKLLIRTMKGLTALTEEESEDLLWIEDSSDNVNVIVPNLRLSEALIWLRDKARSQDKTPYFIYEHIDNSMAFVPFGTLARKAPIKNYYKFDSKQTDPQSTRNELKTFIVNKAPNAYNSITSGMFAAKIFSVDLITKEVKVENYSIDDFEPNSQNLLNNTQLAPAVHLDKRTPNEAYDVHHHFMFSTAPDEVAEGVTDSTQTQLNLHTDAEKYTPYLQAKRKQLQNNMITCAVTGDINLFPGAVLNIFVPTTDAPMDGADNLDKSLSGRYMLSNIRHVFNVDGHTTVFEAVKDSWI